MLARGAALRAARVRVGGVGGSGRGGRAWRATKQQGSRGGGVATVEPHDDRLQRLVGDHAEIVHPSQRQP